MGPNGSDARVSFWSHCLTGVAVAMVLALVLTIFGYGQGLVMAPLSSAVLSTVKPVSAGAGEGGGTKNVGDCCRSETPRNRGWLGRRRARSPAR